MIVILKSSVGKKRANESWDEQDCAEMPLLASERIEQLQAENKTLKEKHISECCTEWKQDRLDEIEALKESMDELLGVALNVWVECTEVGSPALGSLTKLMKTIEKAEASKEKEKESLLTRNELFLTDYQAKVLEWFLNETEGMCLSRGVDRKEAQTLETVRFNLEKITERIDKQKAVECRKT